MNPLSLAPLPALTVNPEFVAIKAQALQSASFVGDVTNSITQQVAVDALGEVTKILKFIEDSRVDVKKGPLGLCKAIDDTARGASAELETAKMQLKRKLSDYQRKLDEEAARKAQEEADRLAKIEKDRLDAIAKAEAEARAAVAPSGGTTATPEESKQLATTVAQAVVVANNEALKQTQQVLAMAKPVPKAEGASTRRPWKYEVLDLKALYAARPELVDLTARGRDILSHIAAGAREIPGLRIYQDIDVGVR